MPLQLHHSKRAPAPLTDADCDHEIRLIDSTVPTVQVSQTRSQSANGRDVSPSQSESSRRYSDAVLGKHPMKAEITRLKYGKFQGRKSAEGERSELVVADSEVEDGEENRGRTSTNSRSKVKIQQTEPESAIDILYENQRGLILCGMKLFASKALGNLDPAPWTNAAQKPSATDITNAQPPDPSWEWVWKEWTVNHDDGVDDEGWEYSFAFAKAFSWHGPSWYNSFVRRRAWIRKRIKKTGGDQMEPRSSEMLSPEYFSVQPSRSNSRSRVSNSDGDARASKSSLATSSRYAAEDGPNIVEDITTIKQLLDALRNSRIDREKLEAIENFCSHGGGELHLMKDNMGEIMHQFVFQASRRLLLSHLTKILKDVIAEQKAQTDKESGQTDIAKKKIHNMEEAVNAADEELKKLEFPTNDVKQIEDRVDEVLGSMGAEEQDGVADGGQKVGTEGLSNASGTDKGKGRGN
ncbi:hypothetical protein F5884DRAFT_75112 [Xylogone sp. PMI_703]|nr:hypothetical protein F5884DRAFT_75112 [Xylogone sp. PMI_703]